MTDLRDVEWSSLPVPKDDGDAKHLLGESLPAVSLPSSDGSDVLLSSLQGLAVLYAYPMTGQPGVALPDGWDAIPGARGCTPQACAFRDHAGELTALGVRHLYGVSTQTPIEQAEAVDRLHLPFALLSDAGLRLQEGLRLPTFTVDGRRMLRRLTIIVEQGVICAVFYPVFPPDRAPDQVIGWLQKRTYGSAA